MGVLTREPGRDLGQGVTLSGLHLGRWEGWGSLTGCSQGWGASGAQHQMQSPRHGHPPESRPNSGQTLLTHLLCAQGPEALHSEWPGMSRGDYQPEGNARLLLDHSLAE